MRGGRDGRGGLGGRGEGGASHNFLLGALKDVILSKEHLSMWQCEDEFDCRGDATEHRRPDNFLPLLDWLFCDCDCE